MVKKRFLYIFIVIFIDDYFNFICVACEAGSTGDNCKIKCLYPLYGQGCQSTCKCTKEDCNSIYGCINQTGNICIGYVICDLWEKK